MREWTRFSQHDPRWAGQRLGRGTPGKPGVTIQAAGCLLCAVASMLSDFGVETDPGRLNRWLIGHGGYAKQNLFVWASVGALGMQLSEIIRCAYTPAPVEQFAALLARGQALIVQVDAQPGGQVNQHWVRLLAVKDGDAAIMDPWQEPGEEIVPLLRQYGKAKSWDLKRAIFMAAAYAGPRDGNRVAGE